MDNDKEPEVVGAGFRDELIIRIILRHEGMVYQLIQLGLSAKSVYYTRI